VDLDKALRRERVGLYAFTMQGLYATGVAAVELGIARAMLSELITLAPHKAPRGLRLADNAVMQADLARAKARLGERLPHRHAHNAEADDVAPIDVTNRARVQLAAPTRSRARSSWETSQGSGRRRDLPGQSVRAALPRHAHALSADPGTHRPFCCESKVTHTE
jgi:hypothetical protein